MEIREDAARSAKLDKLIANRLQGTGLALAVIRDRRPVHVAGYGLARRATHHGEPLAVTPRTRFHIASCGKQLTGVGIMMLQESGQLRYDDHIGAHIPELAGFPPGVTIRRLLHHLAGVYDYYDDARSERLLRELSPNPTNAHVIRLYQELEFAMNGSAGTDDYSNPGYDLLGCVIERVSGQSYRAFFRDRVFVPLGMTDSFSLPDAARLASIRCAAGYEKRGARYRAIGANWLDGICGAGSFYTSVADLCRYEEALAANRLVSAASMKQALTSAIDKDRKRTGYGFGWDVEPTRMSHSGGWGGFESFIIRARNRPLSVYVLGNGRWPDPARLANRAFKLFS
jgi:CubicO group peptidase (beta-lactamase class C family)